MADLVFFVDFACWGVGTMIQAHKVTTAVWTSIGLTNFSFSLVYSIFGKGGRNAVDRLIKVKLG